MEQEKDAEGSDDRGGGRDRSSTQHLTTLADKLAESQDDGAASCSRSPSGETITAGFERRWRTSATRRGRRRSRAARFGTLTRAAGVPVRRRRGTRSSRDAWAAVRDRDDDAIDRIRKFRKQSEDMASSSTRSCTFAPQTTSTASQVIPPGYRPDLYVADLFRERPLVNMASQGTIANATPFTVPTFTSVTTGSATHVEGTNPSDGSLAFAHQDGDAAGHLRAHRAQP